MVFQDVDTSQVNKFNRRLVKWYKKYRRDFPWRLTRNPYDLLIAEILLQKTNARKVTPVYSEIIRRYPSPQKLNRARLTTLQRIVTPIGLVSRAEVLKTIASELVRLEKNQLDYDLLIKIKGVGKYIARSVLIHSSGESYSLLDPNFIRIYSRVFGLTSSLSRPRNDALLWKKAEELIPKRNLSRYCYAIIDFGALVCTSRKPECQRCTMFKHICVGLFID